MKKNPGRKERRNKLYHKSSGIQMGHGKPNTIHAMGVLKPTVNTNIGVK